MMKLTRNAGLGVIVLVATVMLPANVLSHGRNDSGKTVALKPEPAQGFAAQGYPEQGGREQGGEGSSYHPRERSKPWLKEKRKTPDDPQTVRHEHFIKGHDKPYRGNGASGFTHQHGKALPHSHQFDDFIHISPEATRWPVPRPGARLREGLSLPAGLAEYDLDKARISGASILTAHVVFQEERGVSVIRNVNTFRQPGLPVADQRSIGVSELVKPVHLLSDEELAFCNRRLRMVSKTNGPAIRFEGARYCQ